MESVKQLWASVMEEILNSGISSIAYDIWIKCLEPHDIKDGEMVLYVNTEWQKSTILKEYGNVIQSCLKKGARRAARTAHFGAGHQREHRADGQAPHRG